jgi:hypothetical protein
MMLIKQLERDYHKAIYIKVLNDIHLEKVKVIAVGRKKEVKKMVKML